MSRRRRAVLLAGLAITLGGLAASDVSRRERALARRIGPLQSVLTARRQIAAGELLRPGELALSRVPARFVPPGTYAVADEVAGARLSDALPAGAYLTPAYLAPGDGARAGAPVRPGERVAEVVATGSPDLIDPGSRVDVLVTRESDARGGGTTTLALEDVEVLAVNGAPSADAGAQAAQGPRVAVSLRVTVRQAVYLAAAQSFARELRLLPRAAGDGRRGAAGTSVGAALGG